MSKYRRRFHYEDEEGAVIEIDPITNTENWTLSVWAEGNEYHSPKLYEVSLAGAARFVEWAIKHGVKSAVAMVEARVMRLD